MKILNLGSLNIDKVYGVEQFVTAGQTISSKSYEEFCGGKGLNQSVAAARAGAEVYHLGAIGEDGAMLRELMVQAGVRDKYLQTLPAPSGHAVIQVSSSGQNCIIVHGGANHLVSTDMVDHALKDFGPGDMLMLQNETSCVAYAIEAAHRKGLTVALTPAPITQELLAAPLHLVDCFILNEGEGNFLAQTENNDSQKVLTALRRRFPNASFALTVGKNGVYYLCGDKISHHGIYDMPVLDTTAAGDTFCGFFLASLAREFSTAEALHYASVASSISVSRMGAAPSIPTWEEVIVGEKTMRLVD